MNIQTQSRTKKQSLLSCYPSMTSGNHRRSGKIALMTAILLVVLIGSLACAFDIGWMAMTKTQLQAAADSSALAGGTELLDGLGIDATKTPSEVQSAVFAQSESYASKNRAGDRSDVYIQPNRDVKLGTARFDTEAGHWAFQWGNSPYNAVQVTARRNVEGGSGDEPLPLFFAPILGHDYSTMSVLATAVIMPAKGVRVLEGGAPSGLSPFAYDKEYWDKYWRAQEHFKTVLGSNPALINELILDIDGRPLYYDNVLQGMTLVPLQIFNDAYRVTGEDTVAPGPDGKLEFNIYPIDQTAGNFGTVDIGPTGNSTADLVRQILYGPSPEDMAYFENSELSPTESNPYELDGDTGISAGIKDALESIVGQCRGILLFSSVENPGDTAIFTIVDLVGMRVMHIDFQGKFKVLIMQPCKMSDGAGVPDDSGEIDGTSTYFTPLILAQ